MSDPHPKPPGPQRTRAQEEAAEWLARLGHHSISTRTVREFRDWRDDPANDAAYEEVEAFWDASGQHAADPEILRMTQAALDRGKRRPARWRAWLRGPRLAGALTLASIAALGGGYLGLQQLTPAYATEAVEQKVVRLEDGSRVHLNVDSRIKVAFSEDRRRIVLARGEAVFDVAHDAARPFVVEADGARIRALGTKFGVRREAGAVQVTLLQGAVQVRPEADGPAVVLKPNQQAFVSNGHVRTAGADAAQATSWTTGRLVFRDTPLAMAVTEVNRYGGHRIELRGPGLAAKPVSGFFDVGDSESFARGVADLFDLQLSRAPDGAWRLAPRAAPAPTGARGA